MHSTWSTCQEGKRGQVSYTSPQILWGKICHMYQIMASERRFTLGLRIPKPGCCLTVVHSVIITGLVCFRRVTCLKCSQLFVTSYVEGKAASQRFAFICVGVSD